MLAKLGAIIVQFLLNKVWLGVASFVKTYLRRKKIDDETQKPADQINAITEEIYFIEEQLTKDPDNEELKSKIKELEGKLRLISRTN